MKPSQTNTDAAWVTSSAWALMRADNVRDPRAVGSSQIGRCIGELGYLISGAEFTDPGAVAMEQARVGKDALMGIAIHKAVLPYVVKAWLAHGAVAAWEEITLTATFEGVELTGHSDIAAETAPGQVEILDLKTVSENAWNERFNSRSSAMHHILQGADYCARYEASHPGTTVKQLTIWYVNRNRNADDLHFTFPYRGTPIHAAGGRDLATLIAERHALLAQAVADPDKVKKEHKYCGSCGFQTRCLGKPLVCEDPGAVVHDEALVDILRDAKKHRQARSSADKDYKKLVAMLDDLAPDDGTYTDGIEDHKLKFKNGGFVKDSDAITKFFTDHADDDTVAEFLAKYDGKLPTKPRAGSWDF